MRVIRTEIYFDDQSVSGANRSSRHFLRLPSEEKNLGFAFAWFRHDNATSFEIRHFKWFRGEEIEPEQIDQALDLLIREESYERFDRHESIRNPKIIEFILEQDVVLERSPPFAIPFKKLLKQTNSAVLLGGYIGARMAWDDPALMLLTIPGGIIAVGSALGVADAMAYGLNKHIKRMFDGK